MKTMKWWFVFVLTTLTTLALFVVFDGAVAGLVSFLISVWNKELSVQVFKWMTIVLFGIEFIITIPIAIKSIKESEGEK